jgi:hypothetical protein
LFNPSPRGGISQALKIVLENRLLVKGTPAGKKPLTVSLSTKSRGGPVNIGALGTFRIRGIDANTEAGFF